ncbi:MAG: T9SS type A sorting domain-containing protein [Bacteroidetes bacterium]|nr:T9SS type A sorting domain-containing protein [Bacteroidota bacterium]
MKKLLLLFSFLLFISGLDAQHLLLREEYYSSADSSGKPTTISPQEVTTHTYNLEGLDTLKIITSQQDSTFQLLNDRMYRFSYHPDRTLARRLEYEYFMNNKWTYPREDIYYHNPSRDTFFHLTHSGGANPKYYYGNVIMLNKNGLDSIDYPASFNPKDTSWKLSTSTKHISGHTLSGKQFLLSHQHKDSIAGWREDRIERTVFNSEGDSLCYTDSHLEFPSGNYRITEMDSFDYSPNLYYFKKHPLSKRRHYKGNYSNQQITPSFETTYQYYTTGLISKIINKAGYSDGKWGWISIAYFVYDAKYRNLVSKTIKFYNYSTGRFVSGQLYKYYYDSSSTSIEHVTPTPPRLQLSPNPTLNSLNIKTNYTQNVRYSISDITGRILLEGKSTNQDFSVDVSALASGVYFIQCGNEKGVGFGKFVKE